MTQTRLTPEILTALTRIAMPRGFASLPPENVVQVNLCDLPVHSCQTLVIGSGAAGLRAACEAKRRGREVLVATGGMYMGTSACSGSDKQTLHTASTGRNGDNFEVLARDLAAGGCMDEDVAYVEAVGSIGAMAGLQYIGLDLPEDRLGAVLRYQTDHDEYGRATSCGPRTSRLMVKVLLEEAQRLGIPFMTGAAAVKILTTGEGEGRCVSGLVVANKSTEHNPYGLAVIACEDLIIATGGPGEMYRDSVYPKKCFGALGLALEAGLELSNLTESQFGIGTPRETFPWNLSGTYVQVMPYVFSRDAAGNEFNFLADYYRSTRELVSNVFRKGYQWPFHASRMLEFGSSLVDIAVHLEIRKGREVFLDFLRNPLPGKDGAHFNLDDLEPDVRAYLENNGALDALPIDRLVRMNPLAIELYRMNGIDITKEPLRMAVNNQHMNGGIEIDLWGRTNLAGCYAVGEAASTHGVTRPGGSALISGQVFATRVAKHIAHEARQRREGAERSWAASLAELVQELETVTNGCDGLALDGVKHDIQKRMSEAAGFVCAEADVTSALEDALALVDAFEAGAVALREAKRAGDYFMWKQMALSSAAVLQALNHYLKAGGGSRGARVILDDGSTGLPETVHGPLEAFRFRPEREKDKAKKIIVRQTADGIACCERPLKGRDRSPVYFERGWGEFLSEQIFQTEG
ncbi:FAD-binding protein [Pseudovibrio exalbescens]|uniref:FAD-binding protein n=1 Tax=Pseudovibrio exalbescens TaxID=197461 RepID=UPI002365E5F6|nr:FAD-binding protein [Pseudovibrio exalbescens]MDD7912056.1 FAD-binding protein [Pseudovibrio exalbescens]